MSTIAGFLRELTHEVSEPIEYQILFDNDATALNDIIGESLCLSFSGVKRCIHCGRKVNKLYQNGYCFPCVTTLAECDLCIVKPHECHFHKGTCRDAEFAMAHCMIPHYVYLAFSSSVKVGLTRKGRQLRRWVDQGATAAVLLAELPTRKVAGELEMEIAQYLPDKTDWRKMLREDAQPGDLLEVKRDIVSRLPVDYAGYVIEGEETVYRFSYPRLQDKEVNLTPIALDKTATYTGVFTGVKGQYMLFENGVFNVKKHAGYHVQLSVGS